MREYHPAKPYFRMFVPKDFPVLLTPRSWTVRGRGFALAASALVFVAASHPASAQAPAEKIDLSRFPAASVDDVVVPVPSEVFVVLDKLGMPNWRAEYLETPSKAPADRTRIALLLGVVIANGFVAVEAEDPEKVKEIGKEVLRLAEAINVRKAVIGRSKSITEKAEQKNWQAVRVEFDGALQDVRGAMVELNDEDLAQLVSLGGWIRGTQTLTSIVQKSFTKEGAELLYQPQLLDYFSRQIDTMPPRMRKNQIVGNIRKTLDQIRPLIGKNDGSKISPDAVKRIHGMTSDIVKQISASE